MRTNTLLMATVLCLDPWPAPAQAAVSTTDGLALEFFAGGHIAHVATDGRSLPTGLIAGGFYASEAGGHAEEVLANGSLERDDDGDGVPDGFSSGGRWQQDGTVARTGQWSMKAEIPGKKDAMSGSFGIVAPVEGGATYVASFWLMQQGDDGPAEDREKWMQTAMLYGIAPNIVGGTQDPARYERWRPLYRKYMPVIIALCEAGWEPVTHATVEPPSVLIERFGPKDGALYFTARNEAQHAVEAAIVLDNRALGLAAPHRITRLPGARSIAVRDGRFRDTIEAGVTCAYRLTP